MKTNQLAPFARINEHTSQFFLNGFIYEKKGSELRVIETPSSIELRKAIQIYENFEIGNHTVSWYLGKHKFYYNINEGTFMWNNTQILDPSFVKHVQAAGAIHFQDLRTAELFESVPSALKNFILLDNCASFESSDQRVKIDVFIVENRLYVMRYNTQTKLTNFFEEKNSNNLVDYIKEQTGESALTFLSSHLQDEMAHHAKIQSKIDILQEMLSYLNDKRDELSQADKSLPEIRKADSILKSEIETIKSQINELQS